MQLAAPGRTGADFQINVRADVLTISCRPQEENGSAASAQWSRREFRTSAFERQFLLNEKIDAESISARYADGILVVMLPKHPEAHTPAKDIFVA